jgi:hypothetical protein
MLANKINDMIRSDQTTNYFIIEFRPIIMELAKKN